VGGSTAYSRRRRMLPSKNPSNHRWQSSASMRWKKTLRGGSRANFGGAIWPHSDRCRVSVSQSSRRLSCAASPPSARVPVATAGSRLLNELEALLVLGEPRLEAVAVSTRDRVVREDRHLGSPR